MPKPTPPSKELLASVGGAASSSEGLFALVYDELQAIARACLHKYSASDSLHPTALINEAYLRLTGGAPIEAEGRTHFRVLAARAMSRVLIDAWRRKKRQKHGGDRKRVSLVDVEGAGSPTNVMDAIDFLDALVLLRARNPRHADVVELRYFGGLSNEEIAEQLHVTSRTVRSDWRFAIAWLRSQLAGEDA